MRAGESVVFFSRAAFAQNEKPADVCGDSFIPSDWRPPIWVRVLPALENIFYGANISNILSAHKSTFLDIIAWLPYGIMHFGAPAVCSIIMFIFASPGTVPVFAKSYGFMNLIGVAIQLTFPCSPPWYENMYGLAPANYSIKGSPAGLARIDELFGIALYTPTFTGSPMVFGAFPSLHAGSAVMEALFMSHVFPRLRPVFVVYALWLWWATMYLSHHYAVDLVGGSLRTSTLTPRHVCLTDFRSCWKRFLRRQSEIPSKDATEQDVALGLRVQGSRRRSNRARLRISRPRQRTTRC